jgi:hypothetical protein
MDELKDDEMRGRIVRTKNNNRRDIVTLFTNELSETNRVAVRRAQFKLVSVSEVVWAWRIGG